MQIEVQSATIVRLRHHPDRVFLNFNLPEPVFPGVGTLSAAFTVPRDAAEVYLTTHFPGLSFEVIVNDSPYIPFSKKKEI